MSTITFIKDLEEFDEQLFSKYASVLNHWSFAGTWFILILLFCLSLYWRKFDLPFQEAIFALKFYLGVFFNCILPFTYPYSDQVYLLFFL